MGRRRHVRRLPAAVWRANPKRRRRGHANPNLRLANLRHSTWRLHASRSRAIAASTSSALNQRSRPFPGGMSFASASSRSSRCMDRCVVEMFACGVRRRRALIAAPTNHRSRVSKLLHSVYFVSVPSTKSHGGEVNNLMPRCADVCLNGGRSAPVRLYAAVQRSRGAIPRPSVCLIAEVQTIIACRVGPEDVFPLANNRRCHSFRRLHFFRRPPPRRKSRDDSHLRIGRIRDALHSFARSPPTGEATVSGVWLQRGRT